MENLAGQNYFVSEFKIRDSISRARSRKLLIRKFTACWEIPSHEIVSKDFFNRRFSIQHRSGNLFTYSGCGSNIVYVVILPKVAEILGRRNWKV